MTTALPPRRCPHCEAEFTDSSQSPGSMALCCACGRNFILPAAPRPLEPIFDAPAEVENGIERKMLVAAVISWAVFVLLIGGALFNAVAKVAVLELAIGIALSCGYIPFLIAATIMGFSSPPQSRGRVIACIAAMWLPLGLSALGLLLPWIQR